jgi:hypothetical protein
MNLLVVVPPSRLDRLELLSRYRGISVSELAWELLDQGLHAALSALPPKVLDAIDTLVSGADQEPKLTDNSNAVVEYEAARLRFVKKKIDPMHSHDTLRIKVPGAGIFEMTKQQALEDFANVFQTAAYNQSGYYHYSTLPRRALKYRVRAY